MDIGPKTTYCILLLITPHRGKKILDSLAQISQQPVLFMREDGHIYIDQASKPAGRQSGDLL